MSTTKSTHRVEVIEVHLEPHPNADTLSIVHVFGGYPCVVRTADCHEGQLAAYVPPDSVVDTKRPEFAFLRDSGRVRGRKLRGVMSLGLLVPAPPGSRPGDDVADRLGVRHYEPPLTIRTEGQATAPPPGNPPGYDVDTLRRYPDAFEAGELVRVTEKIHGTSARFCCVDGKIHVGSRACWFEEDPHNVWWQALRVTPVVEDFCRQHPGLVIYGEVYGAVQDLRYGTGKGQLRFAAFDLWDAGRWLDVAEFDALTVGLPVVPVVAAAEPYDLEAILRLADGPSLVPGADHVREGIVVRPLKDRVHPECGRLILKVVGTEYLARPSQRGKGSP